MGYRNLGEALEDRRRALESERNELERKLSDLHEIASRRESVDAELSSVTEKFMGLGSQRRLPLLQRLSVASPCSASWDAMPGDERRRFCRGCSKHVYNLSAMTADEVEALVYETEGELCARFFRRHDGTVLTSDCPDRTRRRRRRAIGAFGVMAAGLCGGVGVFGYRPHTEVVGAVALVEAVPPRPAGMGSVAGGKPRSNRLPARAGGASAQT